MKAQSKATKNYDEKNGIIAKTYKLKIDIVNDFAEACEENGKTQTEVLMRLMKNYANGKCFCSYVKKHVYD